MPTETTTINTSETVIQARLGANGAPCRLELATGLLSPRVVSRSVEGARIAFVATAATLLGGDEIRITIDAGPGCRLDVADVAATVAYHGRGRAARLHIEIRVEAGATLVWRAEPLVVAEGAIVERATEIDVAAGGRLLLRDTIALGRSGELAGKLLCRTRVGYDGVPVLVEDLELGPHLPPGMLGNHRILDSALAIGWRPRNIATSGPTTFRLDGPGVLARQLSDEAHHSAIGLVVERWSNELSTDVRDMSDFDSPKVGAEGRSSLLPRSWRDQDHQEVTRANSRGGAPITS